MFVGNIPEAVSKLVEDVEILKSEKQNSSIVRTFSTDAELTEEILSSFKTGDILNFTSEGQTISVIVIKTPEGLIGNTIVHILDDNLRLATVIWLLGGNIWKKEIDLAINSEE